MPKAVDPYSRLYWRLIDDEKFAGVYHDDHAFALWTRLLMAADMAWPASAALPFATRKAALKQLVDVHLVDLLPGGRYRIHGLDAERGRRQQRARGAAGARWDDDGDPGSTAGADEPPMPVHPSSSANGMQPHPSSTPKRMPSRDETRRDEKSRDETSTPRATGGTSQEETDLQILAEELTGQPYALANLHSKLGEMAFRQLGVHGWEATERAWREVAADAGGRPTLRQLVLGADDRLDPIPQAPRLTAADRKAVEHQETLAKIREEMARAR